MEKRTMGSLMSALRKSKGMTQQDVADKLGVSNKAVSKWECDDGYPDISVLPAIAELYGITVDELLRGEIRNEEKEIKPVSIEKSNKQREFLLKNALLKFSNLSIIALVIATLSSVLCIAIEQSIYSISIDRYALAAGVSIIVASVAIVIELFAKNKFLFTISSAQEESPEEDLGSYYLSLRNYMTAVFSVSSLGIIIGILSAIESSAALLEDGAIIIISILLSIFASLIIFYFCNKAYNKNSDDEKSKIRSAYVRQTAKKALIGTVIIAVSLFTAIRVIDKANSTHKYKFESEEELTAYMEYREEGKAPLFSKDDEKLTAVVFVGIDDYLYLEEVTRSPMASGIVDEEFYDAKYDDGSSVSYITETHRFRTEKEYKDFIENDTVKPDFLFHSPEILNIRGHRVSYNIQNCTVIYSDGNFSDIVPLVIIFDATVCLVFIAVYSVIRYKKFKKSGQ